MNPVCPHRIRICIVTLVSVFGCAGALMAQETNSEPPVPESPTNYAPGRSQAVRLALPDALTLTITFNPQVNLARQRMLEDGGRLREGGGPFDPYLTLRGAVGFDSHSLTSSELEAERAKRKILRLVAEEYQSLADALRRRTNLAENRIGVASGETSSPGREDPVDPLMDEDVGYDIGSTAGAIEDSLRAAYEEIASRSRRTLRQIGLMPEYQDRESISLGLNYTKGFRNGLILTPGLELKAIQDNFRGKRISAAWGGRGVKDNFRSTASVSLTMPLGKNRGRVATGSVERASRLNLEAAMNAYAAAMADAILKTSLAYWKLLQAQEQLVSVEESSDRDDELTSIGETLLDAKQMTLGELAQIRARAFESRARVQKARQDVLQARLALADAIGLQVDTIPDAPLVSSTWPAIPDSATLTELRVKQLANLAVQNRPDLAAARKRQESAQILADAARANLKRRKDLELSLSFRGLHEGGTIESPVSMCRGFAKSIFGYYPGPSFKINLTVDLPFHNNVAKGRCVQAQSLQEQSRIQHLDLERTIRGRMAQLVTAVATATGEVARRNDARTYSRQVLDAEFDKFRAGESSVDTMLRTEEEMEAKDAAVSSARMNLATVLSQLRFEAGALLRFTIDKDGGIHVQEIRPVGLGFAS